MSWNSKVVWSEGMFLRPQHFQQQDRYVETLVNGRSRYLRPYDWGIKELTLDSDVLGLGKVAIARCTGVLPDGTPVRIPDDHDPPPPLDIEDDLRDTEIVLAISLKRPGMPEIDRTSGTESVARFRTAEYEVRDNNVGFDANVQIEIGQPRLRLLPKQGDLSEYAITGIAWVVEKRSDQTVVLENRFIPPCLDCRNNTLLNGFTNEVLGALRQKIEAGAAKVSGSGSGRGGVAEVADFMRLQMLNRYEPLFAHLSEMRGLHPEALYQTCLALAGEFATFTSQSRQPPRFPVYDHDDLRGTFTPLMAELRRSFSFEPDLNAIQLPLQERRYGIHVSPITDRALLDSAVFVLAVKADVAAESLIRNFPKQTKIGPVEHIRQLVNSALPGIELRALPVAPRQIPFHSGTTYFELARSGEHWKQMANSGGFAFFITENYPGIEMAFWAIRG